MVTANILLTLVYLGIVIYLGFVGWKQTRTASDYMLASRAMGPFVMALSYGATFISTSAIIGYGGAASMFGTSLYWAIVFNLIVGTLVAFTVFGPRTRRMGVSLDAHTFPEFLGRRYQSKFIQAFSGGVIFFFIPIYTAAVLIGLVAIVEVYLKVPFVWGVIAFTVLTGLYVITGGLKAVMYTDAFQAILMFFVTIMLIVVAYAFFGGIKPAYEAVTSIGNMVPAPWKAMGHRGWTTGLEFFSPFWLICFTSLIFGLGFGVLALPQLVVRYMTVKTDRQLYRAVISGAIFIGVASGASTLAGPILNAIFVQKFGAIASSVAGGNIDKIIPIYIEKIMPWWYNTLFLLGCLAAAMSTLSALYHVGGTSLGRDLCENIGVNIANKLLAVKTSVLASIILAVVWVFILPDSIIAIATAFFFGLCAATFLPVYLLGLFWRGVTKAGAITSIVAGFSCSIIWVVFFHYKEAAAIGLSKALFGQPNLFAGYPKLSFMWKLQYLDPNIVAFPIALILCVIVSLATNKLPENHVRKCFQFFKSTAKVQPEST
jgi:solute:Na+ symporter, SSS family